MTRDNENMFLVWSLVGDELKGICGNIYQNLKEVLETGKSYKGKNSLPPPVLNAQSHIRMDLGLGLFMKPLFSIALY